jgi:hypothetical protein
VQEPVGITEYKRFSLIWIGLYLPFGLLGVHRVTLI